MKQAPPALERLVAVAAMVLAFLVMASIFVPDPIRAHNGGAGFGPLPFLTGPYPDAPSSDPHAGLELLGELEHLRYCVRMYATDHGPRYTVLDEHGETLLTLATAERIADLVPELPLPMLEFRTGSSGPLMLAPLPSQWR